MSTLHHLQPVFEQQSLSLSNAANDGQYATKKAHKQKKWTYLISDHMTFSSPQPFAVRLNHPTSSSLFDWLIKLIKAEQCEQIFVEDLSLSVQQRAYINHLCALSSVEVTNVPLQRSTSGHLDTH